MFNYSYSVKGNPHGCNNGVILTVLAQEVKFHGKRMRGGMAIAGRMHFMYQQTVCSGMGAPYTSCFPKGHGL